MAAQAGTDAAQEPVASPAPIRITYLLVGAVLGGLWLWGSGEPAWEHLVRTGVFVVVVLPAAYYGAQALRARRGKSPLPTISIIRIIGVKVVLLIIALAASLLLDDVTSHADQIVAAALFLVIALGGPPCHRFFTPQGHTAP